MQIIFIITQKRTLKNLYYYYTYDNFHKSALSFQEKTLHNCLLLFHIRELTQIFNVETEKGT